MYDFEKYYSDMDIKAEVNIDLSGVQIENTQGNPNEHVSNNVCYYITGIKLSNDALFSNAVNVGVNNRVQIKVSAGSDIEVAYLSLFHPMNAALDIGVASEWHPTRKREYSLVLDSSDGSGTKIEYILFNDARRDAVPVTYSYAEVFVTPRYEFITGDGDANVVKMATDSAFSPANVNQNIVSNESVGSNNLPQTMQIIYSILGLDGDRMGTMKRIKRIIENPHKMTKYNAVIGYDTFRSRLEKITEWLEENNFGVDAKLYDSSMSEALPPNIEDATAEDYTNNPSYAKFKHRRYVEAVKYADRTRTSMGRKTSFAKAYGNDVDEDGDGAELKKFLEDPRVKPLIDNFTPSGDGVTALIPPIKDAVRGLFYPREEIENDFYTYFEEVYDAVKDAMDIMRSYLSSKLKRRIGRLGDKYSNYADQNGHLGFDLDSIINMLDANADDGAYKAMMASDSTDHVIVYPRVYEINGKYDPDRDVNVTWCANLNRVQVNSAELIHYASAGTADIDYSAENYTWNKKTVKMSSADVRLNLVRMYNWVLDDNDEDEIEEGYLPLSDDMFDDDNCTTNADVDRIVTDIVETHELDEDTAQKYRNCLMFIKYVGAWMNLMRTYDNSDEFEMYYSYHAITQKNNVHEWVRGQVERSSTVWNMTETYDVFMWDTASSVDDGVEDYDDFEPIYELDWGIEPNSPEDIDDAVRAASIIEPNSPEDIDDAVRAASIMVDAYKEMRSQLVYHAFHMSAIRVILAWDALETASDSIDKLEDVLDKIIWYQTFVNESVFTNKSFYLDFSGWLNKGSAGDDDDFITLPFTPWALPARIMVPVAMYRKVRKKYRRWGRTRHRTVKVYDGVRWAEIRFYDLNVYSEYPVVEDEPGTVIQLGKTASIEYVGGHTYVNFEEPLPLEIWNAGRGELRFDDVSGTTMQVTFDGDMSATSVDGNPPELTGTHVVASVKVPPEHSRNDTDEKRGVTVHLRAPSLPYDEEIRKRAFVEYGPMSQNRYFEVYRYGGGGFPGVDDSDRIDGWKIFRPTSRKIDGMREGIGLYDKVSFLMSILSHEFGKSRVELISTWRSADDQKGICTGGDESAMLSWHNYGMAAKILVYQNDGITPIVDKSADMKRLVKIARAFTEICADGRVGDPCNVVWCGRLTINPSLFDWEFLPIGVGHKDAIRFREAVMSQKDPVVECSYVDVDGKGIVGKVRGDSGNPFISVDSRTYRNAIVINGHHYVDPARIWNYSSTENIVLYDILEFINLVRLKMGANGNTLGDRANMYEWKSVNDSACEQLIRYFALTNNIKSAKALIAGDFVEKYQAIEDAYYSSSVVDYVKGMLGNSYYDVSVTIDNNPDAGYISLSDGRMHIQVTDLKPDNKPTMLDMHGQQRVDGEHVKRGIWRNGIFYTADEIEIPHVVTDTPVIDGYVDGVASYGAAMYLHQAIASSIHEAYVGIRELFERYSGPVMYDRFRDGPNAGKFAQLENEFGAIAAQELMDFDDMESMLARDDINRMADIESNGERNGIGRESGRGDLGDGGADVSIYEKVVNNAQLAGMRKAVRTSERMHITDRGNGMTPGEIYKAVMEGRAPSATDIV